MGQGTSEARFLFEFDGIASVQATDVSAIDKDHKPVELYVGNRPNPILSRGNFTCSEVTVKHADALNSAGIEAFQWLDDFISGRSTQKRSGRLIVLDEDGTTPVATYEMTKCMPLKFRSETHTAGGNNPSYFSFSFRPEDWQLI